MENKLEKRMYFFVPYNISEIAKGIQAGHAALEYMIKFWEEPDCIDFRENWKTWIILNGGTTNSKPPIGTLNQIHEDLWENGVNHSYFHEPDLNDTMTAVCFICDEQVFNKDLYPDFIDFVINVKMYPEARKMISKEKENGLKSLTNEDYQRLFPEFYSQWLILIGGQKNAFLKELINGKKLA